MAFNYKVAGDKIVYIPKWNDERGKYQRGEIDDPIKVHIRLITMAESEEWGKKVLSLQVPTGVSVDGLPAMSDNSVEIGKQQFFSSIPKIEGLKFNDVDITNGKELWGTPLKELIAEIGLAAREFNILSAGDVTNLKRASSGFSVATTGTAQPA